MDYTPIPRNKISSQIFISLQDYLQSHTFQPGARLPSERELAKELNVSRNSLREAFRVMEILGMIEIIPGSGTYIKESTHNTIIPLAMSLSLENISSRELMEVRTMLEIQGVVFASLRRTQEDIAQLAAVIEDFKHTVKLQNEWNGLSEPFINAWLKADDQFHYLVAKAAANPLFLRLFYTINDSLQAARFKVISNRFTSDAAVEKTLNEHVLIFEAIVAQDTFKADEYMRQHLADVTQDLS